MAERPFLFQRFWNAISHLSTAVWLVGIAGGFITAARASSVMEGGWLQNPFVPLAWFFSTLAFVVAGGRVTETVWRRMHPPVVDIRPHGGRDVTLEIRPSFTDKFYGIGRFTNLKERTRPFPLGWSERGYVADAYIKAGDSETMFISGIEGTEYEPFLLVYSGADPVVRSSLKEEMRRGFPEDLMWFEIQIELRSKSTANTWKRQYRFRLAKGGQFEVEEVSP